MFTVIDFYLFKLRFFLASQVNDGPVIEKLQSQEKPENTSVEYCKNLCTCLQDVVDDPVHNKPLTQDNTPNQLVNFLVRADCLFVCVFKSWRIFVIWCDTIWFCLLFFKNMFEIGLKPMNEKDRSNLYEELILNRQTFKAAPDPNRNKLQLNRSDKSTMDVATNQAKKQILFIQKELKQHRKENCKTTYTKKYL